MFLYEADILQELLKQLLADGRVLHALRRGLFNNSDRQAFPHDRYISRRPEVPALHCGRSLTPDRQPTPSRYEDMGFFSSRKAEEVAIGTNDKSVVQVIRSRFVRSFQPCQC